MPNLAYTLKDTHFQCKNGFGLYLVLPEKTPDDVVKNIKNGGLNVIFGSKGLHQNLHLTQIPLAWGFTCPTPSDSNQKRLIKDFLQPPNFSKIFKLGFLNPILVTSHTHQRGPNISIFSGKTLLGFTRKKPYDVRFGVNEYPCFAINLPKMKKKTEKKKFRILPIGIGCPVPLKGGVKNICWGRRILRGVADSSQVSKGG